MSTYVSAGLPDDLPHCEGCAFFVRSEGSSFGWCQHPDHRVFTKGWPNGFTPSVAWNGGCTKHKRHEHQ